MRSGFKLLFWAILLVAGLEAQEREKLHKLFADALQDRFDESPGFATAVGKHGYADRWQDHSPEAREKFKRLRRERSEELRRVDRSKLPAADQLNYDLFARDLDFRIRLDAFPNELLAIDPLSRGPQITIPTSLANAPARTVKDYEDAISRIESSGRLIDQVIVLLKQGVARGITTPAIILRDVPDQLTTLSSGNPADSPLLEIFRKFPGSFTEEERTQLTRRAASATDSVLFPAFRRLREYLIKEYIPSARQTIAKSSIPEGEKWYELDVSLHTTMDWTPRQIHEIGQSEIKRIRTEMDAVMRKTGFAGTFPEFLHFLRTDKQFYYTRAEDLLTCYRDISKRIDPELPRLFGKLPRMPYGVRPVPDHVAPSQTTALYFRGDLAGTRPGYFVANTYKLETRPKYEMEALTLHEAVPGHHLQMALALELPDVPEFRRVIGVSAFTEGWGLYAESLGEELGFYKDPYSKFGQLSFEMWRACRLVVDTGMHALGWTRQQAIDFMKANTSSTEQNIVVEVDRYIASPGQALAYKIGELKIKELRKRAEQALGAKFDVRAFHDAVLANGAVPLDVLESHVVRTLGLPAPAGSTRLVRPSDLLDVRTPPGTRIQYASGDLQFGELRLPPGAGPHPVVMLIHGGCWVSKIPSLPAEATSLDLLRPMTAALANAGIATWNIEYRRIGNPGGGWPGSFDDLRAAAAHLVKLARTHNLDLERAVAAGHSAGGHLALWIAAESKSPSFRAAVSLDGPADLNSAQPDEQKICGTSAITNFVGGTPEEQPERYKQLAAWPAGRVDFIGGSLSRRMRDQVKLARDRNANVTELPEAGHFDILAPQSPHWRAVLKIFRSVIQ